MTRAPAGDAAMARGAVLEATDRLVQSGGRLLVVSDFDGTLAPISLEPMATRILPAGRVALRRLARISGERPERLAVVVLSGRTALDVAGRVRVGGLRYLGNHGVEGGTLPRGGRAERLSVALDADLEAHAAEAGRIARTVADRLGRPVWLFVEDKGPSVAFHFRGAADADAARVALLAAIDEVETTEGGVGMVLLEGRRVIELRPAGAGHKGAAVARLLAETGADAALMLGDDRSDAEAFAVIRSARASGTIRDGLTVGVHGAAETPPEIMAVSDVVLTGPRDAARLLARVARRIEAETVSAKARPRCA